MAKPLSLERRDEVAVVTLQRPEKRNALSIELRVELAEALGGLGADDAVGCVLLTGAGPAFCSGTDTSEFGGDRPHRERSFAPLFAEEERALREALLSG